MVSTEGPPLAWNKCVSDDYFHRRPHVGSSYFPLSSLLSLPSSSALSKTSLLSCCLGLIFFSSSFAFSFPNVILSPVLPNSTSHPSFPSHFRQPSSSYCSSILLARIGYIFCLPSSLFPFRHFFLAYISQFCSLSHFSFPPPHFRKPPLLTAPPFLLCLGSIFLSLSFYFSLPNIFLPLVS